MASLTITIGSFSSLVADWHSNNPICAIDLQIYLFPTSSHGASAYIVETRSLNSLTSDISTSLNAANFRSYCCNA